MEDREAKRLTPAQWVEAESLWKLGDRSLDDLAAEFGVDRSTMWRHFKKHGVVQNSAAPEMSEEIRDKIVTVAVDDAAVMIKRRADAKEKYYKLIDSIATIAANEMVTVQKEKRSHATSGAVYKSLRQLMSLAQTARNEVWAILGIDSEDGADDLPDLIFKVVHDDDIRARLAQQHKKAMSDLGGEPDLSEFDLDEDVEEND